MFDFTQVVRFIFKDKHNYSKLTDKDKETFFFIVNRRFSRMYPKHAQFFNNKEFDRASSMDIWNYFFIKKGIIGQPSWFQFKQPKTKGKSSIKKDEIEYLMEFYDIKENDVEFLIKHHPDDVKEELKKIRKFKKIRK